MNSFKTEGIVIKRKNYNEADRILTIFTKKKGKITVKAAGVRRIASRRSPHIELLNYSVFSLYQASGASRMPVLTEVETIENYANLKKDLERIGVAFHFCELVDSLCADGQENEEVFDLLNQALNTISRHENLKLVAHRFELKLLKLLGFYQSEQYLEADEMQPFIESILERKLKTRQILHKFS